MDFTIEISKAFNLSPFVVLQQDKDEVIMMINYYIEKADDEYMIPNETTIVESTHSDGFWDF